MTIVWLRPGTGGGFRCENCLRDRELARLFALRGHAVVSVPVYLPLEDEPDLPVFYGAVRLWLLDRFPWLRWIPRLLLRLFDLPVVLRRAGRQADLRDPAAGASLTIAMLDGRLAAADDSAVRVWLRRRHVHPDLVLLSTPLLVRQGGVLRRVFDVPLVSLLGGEDHWVDALGGDFPELVWTALRDAARQVDRFVAADAVFAEAMRGRLDLSSRILYSVSYGDHGACVDAVCGAVAARGGPHDAGVR